MMTTDITIRPQALEGEVLAPEKMDPFLAAIVNDSYKRLNSAVRDVMQSMYPVEGEVLSPDTPLPRYRTENLDLAKRRAGYHRAPECCGHYRKMLCIGRWSCRDCGEYL
jgi:hypothetical protein